MKKSSVKKNRNFAIIGIGPRGGFALENFIQSIKDKIDLSQIHLLLFEETGNFGNGKVYETTQIDSNWINIPERVLELEKRTAITLPDIQIPSFPSYHEWIGKDFQQQSKTAIDVYPPRAKIGTYLQERLQSFIQPLLEKNVLSLIENRVEKIELTTNDKVSIITKTNTYNNIDELLLTIGHQSTELSEQLTTWKKFAEQKDHLTLFTSPYPIKNFLNHTNLSNESSVGIRGFGLAMIDVTRAIAEKFGDFTIEDTHTRSCSFKANTAYNGKLIPFSIDGLPAVPKPLNAFVDGKFKPTETQLSDFRSHIGNAEIQKKASNPDFLLQAFAPIAASVYQQLENRYNGKNVTAEEIEKISIEWLKNPEFNHETILPTNKPLQQLMQDFVEMATGNGQISLDFCIGQVWRHCQPSIYEALSFNECSEEVFAEIIKLDESTKRYSYGPPVESVQQMIALVKADVLDLDMINDPDFELTQQGWKFSANGNTTTATVMINSVLDPPKVKSVATPIVESLLCSDLIQAVHDDLGIMTTENGYVLSEDKLHDIPIALLGRLAKGTIIGVDAILECYGSRPKKWAATAAKRSAKALK